MSELVKSAIYFGLGAIMMSWIIQADAQTTVDARPDISLQEYYFGK